MRALSIACIALAACTASARTPTPSVASQVVVTDGDTIKVRGERVRLSNIDTPELPPGAKCWAEAALAVQAAEAMQGMVERAKAIDVQREGRDRYGRTLARVSFDGLDAGEALVNRGFAAKWTGRRWDWCGPSKLGEAAGPDLMGGPEGNQSFQSWIVARKVKEYEPH